MSLNKEALKNSIIEILNDMTQKEENSIEEFATRLSDAIDDYVKEADINYAGGLTAPNGPVTGTFNATIS